MTVASSLSADVSIKGKNECFSLHIDVLINLKNVKEVKLIIL